MVPADGRLMGGCGPPQVDVLSEENDYLVDKNRSAVEELREMQARNHELEKQVSAPVQTRTRRAKVAVVTHGTGGVSGRRHFARGSSAESKGSRPSAERGSPESSQRDDTGRAGSRDLRVAVGGGCEDGDASHACLAGAGL